MNATHKRVDVHIRWQTESDLEAIVEIEASRALGDKTWSYRDFKDATRHDGAICLVATAPGFGSILGYVVYKPGKHAIEVVNGAVHPFSRRAGVGDAMVSQLKKKLEAGKRERITLVVPESDMRALYFLRSQKFLATQLLRGQYPHDDDDGIRMEYEIDDAQRPPEDDVPYADLATEEEDHDT